MIRLTAPHVKMGKLSASSEILFVILLVYQTSVLWAACPTCPGDCAKDKVDLVFIVDGSGSICDDGRNCQNWRNILNFMVSVVDLLDVRPDGDRVAVVQFANAGKMEFSLVTYPTVSSVRAAILDLQQETGNTNTSGGIYVARTEVFGGPTVGDRNDVENVAVLITDGMSTYDSDRTVPEAEAAKAEGIKIFSIGVTTSIDINEVRRVSADPQIINMTYYIMAGFDQFPTRFFVEMVHNLFCKTSNPTMDNCPGTYSHTGCWIITERGLTQAGAQAECANLASGIGRQGMGQLVSLSSQSLQDEADWLVRALWTKKPSTNTLTEFWVGGHLDSRTFGGQDFAKWTWLNDQGFTEIEPQGCFEDQSSNRDLPYMMDFGDQPMLPENCTRHCADRGYSVAGVQGGSSCYCGNTYGKYGGARSCDIPCSGSPTGSTVYCGGYSQNNIYIIGGAYGDWSPQQPNNYENNQACGVLEGRYSTWEMGDEACYSKNPFICSLAPEASCFGTLADGGIRRIVGGRCIFISQDFSDEGKRTWFDARLACQALGGDLLVLTDANMHAQLKTVMNNVGRGEGTQVFFWIGLLGKRWLWPSGAPLLYHNWGPDEPNDVNHNCMTIRYNTGKTFSWRDGACSNQLPSICHIVVIALATQTPSTTGNQTDSQAQTTSTTDIQTDIQTDMTATVATTTSGTAAGSTSTQGPTTASTETPPASNTTISGPDVGASLNLGGGIGTVELVVIIILACLVLFGIIVGIIACCYYKKGKKKTTLTVHPEKSEYLTANMLIPYNRYYDTDYQTPPQSTSGLVLEAGSLSKNVPDEHAYISFTSGETRGAVVSKTVQYGSKSQRYQAHSRANDNIYDNINDDMIVSRGLPSGRLTSREVTTVRMTAGGTRIGQVD